MLRNRQPKTCTMQKSTLVASITATFGHATRASMSVGANALAIHLGRRPKVVRVKTVRNASALIADGKPTLQDQRYPCGTDHVANSS